MTKGCLRFVAWSLSFAIVLVLLLIIGRSPRLRSFDGELPSRQAVESDRNLLMLAKALPATARDIRYYVRPLGCVIYADFTISKAEFLDWAAAQEWHPLEIQSTRYLEVSPLNSRLVSVGSGFCYDEKRTRDASGQEISSELRVVFDLSISRCYYRFTCEE
jgi:hypothetical protein